jgi:hypothetical protein
MTAARMDIRMTAKEAIPAINVFWTSLDGFRRW